MKKWALAVAIWAMASTAVAGDADNYSLLQCGVKLGGTYIAYKPTANTQKKRDTRLNHVAGVAREEPVRFSTYSTDASLATTSKTADIRLPRKFTFATLGCSWR